MGFMICPLIFHQKDILHEKKWNSKDNQKYISIEKIFYIEKIFERCCWLLWEEDYYNPISCFEIHAMTFVCVIVDNR